MLRRIDVLVYFIILMTYCFLTYPIPSIIVSVIVIIAYLAITKFTKNDQLKRDARLARRVALEKARIYLSPYDNIENNLKLSNKYCSLKLLRDGTTIICTEKKEGEYRTFKIVSSGIYSFSDLWNLFCTHFDHHKTYDGLKSDCRLYKAVIVENIVGNTSSIPANKIKQLNKVDVNNASEIELTALPGISIVLSKKIIKKREEIGGFKNINEFFIYLRLKPHMEKQLRELVCANKMKGSLKIERYNERNVDL